MKNNGSQLPVGAYQMARPTAQFSICAHSPAAGKRGGFELDCWRRHVTLTKILASMSEPTSPVSFATLGDEGQHKAFGLTRRPASSMTSAFLKLVIEYLIYIYTYIKIDTSIYITSYIYVYILYILYV